jgi:hypothetical protein
MEFAVHLREEMEMGKVKTCVREDKAVEHPGIDKALTILEGDDPSKSRACLCNPRFFANESAQFRTSQTTKKSQSHQSCAMV